MSSFGISPQILLYPTFSEFISEMPLKKTDLVITNKFIKEGSLATISFEGPILFQEEYGQGEPSNHMMDRLFAAARQHSYERVIAIGGGSVLDVAKLLVLAGDSNTVEYFDRQVPIKKSKELVLIPTTCGTGSEMTNITILELVEQKTKKGLADPALFADQAVLIPELLNSLPYPVFATSSIDALVHATESFVAPGSNPFSELFGLKAIEMILTAYRAVVKNGRETWVDHKQDFLIASAYAGIAFGNTGVGAVHALSYPLGGIYHVPHGEANQQMFTGVFQMYQKVQPQGKIQELELRLAELLEVTSQEVWTALDELLEALWAKKPLREYGMLEKEIEEFTESVIQNQQRLLKNNYTPLSKEQIKEIYTLLY